MLAICWRHAAAARPAATCLICALLLLHAACSYLAVAATVIDPFGYQSTSHGTKCRALAVAYIKYEKASSAALAVETLHGTVLNDGRGPTLKVMLAEAPNARQASSLLSSSSCLCRQQESAFAEHVGLAIRRNAQRKAA